MKEVFRTEKAEIWFEENRILNMKMLPKADIDAQAAEEICKLASEVSRDRIHCNLVDIRLMTFMNNAARAVFGSQDKSTVKAVAIVNNSILHKSLVNLYFKFNKPKIPTKVFDNEEKAKDWLLEFLR